ncbi:MAG: winged helix DNA-binding domain-containing protein [Clostridiales Family XIII bacterium]|jgi:hypothetical protein|nr:winged helix DNA-binding domain-containing protein [Clostridiales Family XIII bacterium]
MVIQDIPKLRLLNQQLILSKLTTPKEVVQWMGAMQAQDYKASICATCIRLANVANDTNSTYEEVEAAFNDGEFVRTHVLRPTWHLVAAEDIRWLLELTAPRIKAQTHARDIALGLNESDFEKSNAVFTQALRGDFHLLREELAQVLEDAGIDSSGYRLAHLLMRAELDAVICSGARRGMKQTYALLSERAPMTKQFNRETALAMLAMRYFTSRGPATLKDFIWWSGLTTRDARQAIAMTEGKIISAEITSTDICAQTYYFHHRLQDIKNATDWSKLDEITREKIHHLPAFDEYLIAYTDRSAVIAPAHMSKAIASNGIFRPTILHNGIVTGTWKDTNKGMVESYF